MFLNFIFPPFPLFSSLSFLYFFRPVRMKVILQKIGCDGDDEVEREQQKPFPPVALIVVDDQPHAANGHAQGDQFDLVKNQIEILAKKTCDKDADGRHKEGNLCTALCGNGKAQVDLVLHGAGDSYGMFGYVAD